MPIVIPVMDGGGPLKAVSFTQMVVGATAVGVIIPPGLLPRRVTLTVHTGGLRLRFDGGGDPTTTTGHLLVTSSGAVDLTHAVELLGYEAILRFRMCRDGTSDAEVAYTIQV